jgi:putative membrane protein
MLSDCSGIQRGDNAMMGGQWSDFGWWGMGFGMVGGVLVLALMIGFVVWLMYRAQDDRGDARGESSEEVLRRRFASGDIDADEYERRLALLRR